MKGKKKMSINEIVMGMTPQEKDIYFAHQEKRHREEQEKIDLEKQQLRAYKEMLIEDIMKSKPNSNYEDLKKLSIRSLERIY